jgi:ADP-ribose pyrophosphatase
MKAWKTLAREPVLSFGKWLGVEDRTVETPDGLVIEHWAWVTSPDYVNVLAETPDGRFLIFEQGKYGLEGESLAPVGGYIEPGEEPLQAAQRELLEETGCQAADWRLLGGFVVDPNRGMSRGSLFLARGACRVAEPVKDDLEEQRLLYLSRDELRDALLGGRIKVLAWAANVSLALNWLDQAQ